MSRTLVNRTLSTAVLLLVFCMPAWADDSEARPAESPYFFVRSDDPSVDRLPLKSTQVTARISGAIADVAVTQRYRNEGTRPIEARYVFPGSTRAAVHALSVRLGDRRIDAEIREKQRARIEYEQARAEGRTTALLEQERPNVFAMNVANILPGDDVVVELHYTELMAPDEGRYQFVFPTVVGPRYVGAGNRPLDQGGSGPLSSIPYLRAGEASATTFDLEVHFESPLPVSDLVSVSHPIKVAGAGTRNSKVSLDGTGPRNDRDFILDFRLGGDRTATGLLLYKGPEENFFLAMAEPPKAIRPVQINPRDYIFVVDVSGSMRGFPLDTAKQLLRNLIGSLRATDTFNVMLFSGGSQMLHEHSVPATAANIDAAMRLIDDVRGGGGTEIVPALRRVVALPKAPDLSRTVVVVTDGYVSVENEVFSLVRGNLGKANLFSFGIGSSVNRHLIEGMARAGQGEAFIVTRPEDAAQQAERLRNMIEAPVLTNVQARFEGIETYDVEPQTLPDVLGGRPVVIIGKWRPASPTTGIARLTVTGETADGSWSDAVQASVSGTSVPALQRLWARNRIHQLSDDEALLGGDNQREAITQLGLRYSLLTQYTSFIAVDKLVRSSGSPESVDQPSPMPAGVSDAAIGAEVPSTPEPASWISLLVALLALGSWSLWRRRVAAVDPERGSWA